MSAHDHREYVEGCFRCESSRDEVEADADIAAGRTETFDDPDDVMRWLHSTYEDDE